MNHKAVVTALILLAFAVTPAIAEEGKKREGRRRNPEMKQKVQEHRRQQQGENKEFRKGLKDMPKEERGAAVKQHREKQYSENREFREGIHAERRARFEEKLSNNKRLSQEEKQELLRFLDEQHQERGEFRDKQHEENMSFIDEISSYENREERRNAMKAFRQKQQEENKAFRESQRSERKSKMGDFKGSDHEGETD